MQAPKSHTGRRQALAADMDITRWLGLPFQPHGRSRAGCDCWGLVRLFYREEMGILLPAFERPVDKIDDHIAVGHVMTPAFRAHIWHPVEEPRFADLIAFGTRACFYHIGLYLDEETMLHARFGTDSTTEDWRTQLWRPRFQGFYRHTENL